MDQDFYARLHSKLRSCMKSLDRVNSSALAKDSDVPIKEKMNLLETFATNVRSVKAILQGRQFPGLAHKGSLQNSN